MSLEEKIERDLDLLSRGTEDIINVDDLRKKITRYHQTGQPMVVKEGFDPSAPDIHLGHTVTLRKLRQFQDLGHQVVFLIGDFTGRIGDPTGKKNTRKQLNEEEVLKNAQTYSDQAFKILDRDKTVIKFNSTWLKDITFADLVVITSHFTVARMMEREDFAKRLAAGKPVGLHEFLYPIMQAYDSVALRADVELGGTDQRFNLLMGRDMQREYDQEPQVVMMMPLLEGTDGVEKMSKSLDNYIGVHDLPFEMFGKVMSIPDHIVEKYFILLTDVPIEDVQSLARKVRTNELHPMKWKKQLAREIVTIYHGPAAAEKTSEEFDKTFSKKENPEDALSLAISRGELKDGKMWVVQLLLKTGMCTSKSEIRRLIEQGGVYLDGERISDFNTDLSLPDGTFLRVGKKSFFRITLVG